MTPQDRTNNAEQLKANPLFALLLSELEAKAIERMVSADTNEKRLEGQLRIQAVRSFRRDCEAALRSTHEPKAAPA